jgi:hypothetical protein
MPEVTGPIGPTGPELDVMLRADDRADSRQFKAILDTGSTATLVDPLVMAQINAHRVGYVNVEGALSRRGGSRCCRFYLEVCLYNTAGETRWCEVSAAEVQISLPGIDLVIGWDILETCDLLCEGRKRTFKLTF